MVDQLVKVFVVTIMVQMGTTNLEHADCPSASGSLLSHDNTSVEYAGVVAGHT